jgi:hypothetical protein
MARPTKRNKAALDAVCNALEAGATYAQAAGAAGVSYATFARWRDDDADAESAILKAEQVAARRWLACIDRAADSEWRAAAWLLERRFPEVYRRGEITVPEPARRTVYHVRFEGDPDVEHADEWDD